MTVDDESRIPHPPGGWSLGSIRGKWTSFSAMKIPDRSMLSRERESERERAWHYCKKGSLQARFFCPLPHKPRCSLTYFLVEKVWGKRKGREGERRGEERRKEVAWAGNNRFPLLFRQLKTVEGERRRTRIWQSNRGGGKEAKEGKHLSRDSMLQKKKKLALSTLRQKLLCSY